VCAQFGDAEKQRGCLRRQESRHSPLDVECVVAHCFARGVKIHSNRNRHNLRECSATRSLKKKQLMTSNEYCEPRVTFERKSCLKEIAARTTIRCQHSSAESALPTCTVLRLKSSHVACACMRHWTRHSEVTLVKITSAAGSECLDVNSDTLMQLKYRAGPKGCECMHLPEGACSSSRNSVQTTRARSHGACVPSQTRRDSA
jgi:hypothetical protein